MPFYEYRCNKCEHIFEEMHRMSERDTPCNSPCPNCGENTIEISISAGYFMFDKSLRPQGDFREVMQKVKKAHKFDRKAKVKDY